MKKLLNNGRVIVSFVSVFAILAVSLLSMFAGGAIFVSADSEANSEETAVTYPLNETYDASFNKIDGSGISYTDVKDTYIDSQGVERAKTVSNFTGFENNFIVNAQGNGTARNPYIIETANQFASVATGRLVDANGNPLTLGRTTKYSELISAKFANEALINSSITETVNPATPTLMPVSHWATCTVTDQHIHPNCLKLDMPVFRAVAKTQFFMAKMSSNFNLKVTNLELHSNKIPVDGVVLSSHIPSTLNDKSMTATPAWLGSTTPSATAAGSYDLVNSDVTVTEVRESRPTIGTGETAYNYYTHVGAHFLHETAAASTNATDYETNGNAVPTGDGFYYKIEYTVDNNQPITRYVAIPNAILRNRDYQVHALVRADGQIDVNYVVAEWDDVEWNLDFDAPVHTQLLTSADINATAPNSAPVVYFDNSDDTGEKGAFTGYFMMEGPLGVTWKPTLTNASADDYQVRVYTNIDKNGAAHADYDILVTDANIEAEDNRFYKIVVVAKNQNNINKVVK